MVFRRATNLLISLCFIALLSAQTSEADYIQIIQSKIGGEREVVVYGGRVDLVTNEFAFEVEWAPKWKYAIGQGLWYGLQTTKKPAIILIIRSNDEFKYVQQLQSALNYARLDKAIMVRVYPLDFR